jgi:hypothetical protein
MQAAIDQRLRNDDSHDPRPAGDVPAIRAFLNIPPLATGNVAPEDAEHLWGIAKIGRTIRLRAVRTLQKAILQLLAPECESRIRRRSGCLLIRSYRLRGSEIRQTRASVFERANEVSTSRKGVV